MRTDGRVARGGKPVALARHAGLARRRVPVHRDAALALRAGRLVAAADAHAARHVARLLEAPQVELTRVRVRVTLALYK